MENSGSPCLGIVKYFSNLHNRLMTQSGFTEEIIARVANDLTLPEDGWKRRQLERKLRELETEVPIYRRREAIGQPAKVRDRLGRLLPLCEKASPTGSKSFQESPEGSWQLRYYTGTPALAGCIR